MQLRISPLIQLPLFHPMSTIIRSEKNGFISFEIVINWQLDFRILIQLDFQVNKLNAKMETMNRKSSKMENYAQRSTGKVFLYNSHSPTGPTMVDNWMLWATTTRLLSSITHHQSLYGKMLYHHIVMGRIRVEWAKDFANLKTQK